jgi:hypothetical protein
VITEEKLWTTLHSWGTAEWVRRTRLQTKAKVRDVMLSISADCIEALDALQKQAAEIEQLRQDLAQQSVNSTTLVKLYAEIARIANDCPMSAGTRTRLRKLACFSDEDIARINVAADELGKRMVMGKPAVDVTTTQPEKS